jgi:putative ubiquitin-RnfH superfamily antitoxin RatB of RatAB toxin-antitoxin module
MAETTILVEVAYAEAERQTVVRVELPRNSSVRQAVDLSGIVAAELPKGAIDSYQLGVFGNKVAPDRIVQNGDRIEIYRPLLLNPMEARRHRAR